MTGFRLVQPTGGNERKRDGLDAEGGTGSGGVEGMKKAVRVRT